MTGLSDIFNVLGIDGDDGEAEEFPANEPQVMEYRCWCAARLGVAPAAVQIAVAKLYTLSGQTHRQTELTFLPPRAEQSPVAPHTGLQFRLMTIPPLLRAALAAKNLA